MRCISVTMFQLPFPFSKGDAEKKQLNDVLYRTGKKTRWKDQIKDRRNKKSVAV